MRSADYLTAVGIGVSDLDRSEAFYRDVLGMRRMQTFKVEYMDEVLMAHEGRNAVILMHWTDGSSPNYRDLPVKLVFYVTDPAGLAARIRAAGHEVTREPAPADTLGGAIICLAKDPDGYVIELIEAPTQRAATGEAAQATA